MSISLNNHEDRIKKLESGGLGSWEKGSNGTCNWAKEKSSGLKICWSKGMSTQWGTITLPFSYQSTSSYAVVATHGAHSGWQPNASSATVKIESPNTFNVWSAERYYCAWIAIGY